MSKKIQFTHKGIRHEAFWNGKVYSGETVYVMVTGPNGYGQKVNLKLDLSDRPFIPGSLDEAAAVALGFISAERAAANKAERAAEEARKQAELTERFAAMERFAAEHKAERERSERGA